jgi:hypothetical protein
VTDAEWNAIMTRRLDAWIARPHGAGGNTARDLLRWMRMTAAEWYAWRDTGIVPNSTRQMFMTVHVEDFLDA